MNNLTESEAKKKACPYDGSPCGVTKCMGWVEAHKQKDESVGYCARIHQLIEIKIK